MSRVKILALTSVIKLSKKYDSATQIFLSFMINPDLKAIDQVCDRSYKYKIANKIYTQTIFVESQEVCETFRDLGPTLTIRNKIRLVLI